MWAWSIFSGGGLIFLLFFFQSHFSRFDIIHFCQVGNSWRQTQTIEGTVYPRFDRTFYLWVRQLFFISRQMINLHLQWPRWYVRGSRCLNLWWKQWYRGGQRAHGKGDIHSFLIMLFPYQNFLVFVKKKPKDFIHMIINYKWFTKLSLFHLQVVLPLLKIARAPETRWRVPVTLAHTQWTNPIIIVII